MENKWVIVYGDLSEGIVGVVGPFDTETKAEDYADTHNLGHYDKIISKVEAP